MSTKKISFRKYASKSPKETKKIAAALAKEVLKSKRGPFFVFLQGELGAGKTAFVQGFVKTFGIKEKITSPTFIISKRFKIPKKTSLFKNFFHIDCYRIEKSNGINGLEPLGFGEIFSGRENILCIEWPENLKGFLPKNRVLRVKILHKGKNKRKIETFLKT